MTMLNSEDVKKYHVFNHYLNTDFVHVTSKPQVMKAFWKWSGLERDWGNLLFNNYVPPILLVHAFHCEYNEEGKPRIRDGLTVSKNVIIIGKHLVDRAEDVVLRGIHGKRKEGDSHILTVVEATILHEMVHWARMVKGQDEAKMYGDEEYGTRSFEQEAYGGTPVLGIETLCFVQETYKVPQKTGPQK